MNTVKLSRNWDSKKVWPVVRGDITTWPVASARELVALVASWNNRGWLYTDVSDVSDVLTFTEIGEDAGGAHKVEVTYVTYPGHTPALAGEPWQAALEAVLAAQSN